MSMSRTLQNVYVSFAMNDIIFLSFYSVVFRVYDSDGNEYLDSQVTLNSYHLLHLFCSNYTMITEVFFFEYI